MSGERVATNSSLNSSLLLSENELLQGLDKLEEMKERDLGLNYTEDEGLKWEAKHRKEIYDLFPNYASS